MATVELDQVTMLGDTASAAMGRILLLEPDAALRASVADLFEQHGFTVHPVADLPAAEAFLDRQPADIVILGAARPDADGLAFCRRIAESLGARVILVSTAATEIDRVLGLELGADDFLARPYSPRELLARVRAIRRRQNRSAQVLAAPAPIYVFDGLEFDLGRRELRVETGGQALALQAGVSELLRAFLQHPRRVLPRHELLAAAGVDMALDARAVDMRVSRVRQTLRLLNPRDLIRTVRGIGYALDADVALRRAADGGR